MPSIKDSMNDVYKDHTFSKQKQQQILEQLQQECPQWSIAWKPFSSVVAILAIVLLLLVTNTKEETVTTSTDKAPQDADVVLLDRVQQFQQIVKDGEITELERIQYASISDWDLQLAFETGTSIFYNRPAMSKDDIRNVTEILHNMYYTVIDNVPHKEPMQLDDNITFEAFLQIAPAFNEHVGLYIEQPYVSSLTEKPLTNNRFLNMDWWWQIVVFGLFALFSYLFIQNIRIDRKKFAGVLQFIFLIGLGSFFVTKDTTHYSYNETALMEAALNDELIKEQNLRVGKLVNIAQYPNSRAALFELTDGRLLVMEYMKYGNQYQYQGWSTSDGIVFSHFSSNRYNESQTVYGFPKDSSVASIKMIESSTNKQVVLKRDPRSQLQMYTTPEDMTSMGIYYYDVDGNEVNF